jgi:hypothetical protein
MICSSLYRVFFISEAPFLVCSAGASQIMTGRVFGEQVR